MYNFDSSGFSDYFSPEAKQFRAEYMKMVKEVNFLTREFKFARLENRILQRKYRFNKLGKKLWKYSTHASVKEVTTTALSGIQVFHCFLN